MIFWSAFETSMLTDYSFKKIFSYFHQKKNDQEGDQKLKINFARPYIIRIINSINALFNSLFPPCHAFRRSQVVADSLTIDDISIIYDLTTKLFQLAVYNSN